MVSCTIIIEGGGTGPALRSEMAQGFASLFSKINPPISKPRLIRGGGRSQALDKFNTAWKSRKPSEVVLLLIDSEEPVIWGASKLKHLADRDGWERPTDVSEGDVFLMVCVMETWICADQQALESFYNGGFDKAELPKIDRGLEKIPRGRIYECLAKATKNCKKRRPYHKGQHSFELIGELNPATLEVLPHAKQFFDALRRPSLDEARTP